MVLLKDIVEKFDLSDFNNIACSGEFQNPANSLHVSQIGAALINDHLL
ncbi:hypothetical protein CEV33_4784 [Brucella grignonensis]|uniref:Uncharacterized protein n=1 Tax=Brucella grignonensis TaxID=94627 RepID=A0A256G347_9HYPH|nr:hypothetical protein [Brucella grignonensis]OYR21499.1 hypothetical protein CEV33_4784 [Brucella grignonensis]